MPYTFSTLVRIAPHVSRGTRCRINKFIYSSPDAIAARGGGHIGNELVGASSVKNNSVYHFQNYHFSGGDKGEKHMAYSNVPPFACIFVARTRVERIRATARCTAPRRRSSVAKRECTCARMCLCVFARIRLVQHFLAIYILLRGRSRCSRPFLASPLLFPTRISSPRKVLVCCRLCRSPPPLIDMPRQSPLVRSPPLDLCADFAEIYSRAWRETRSDGRSHRANAISRIFFISRHIL